MTNFPADWGPILTAYSWPLTIVIVVLLLRKSLDSVFPRIRSVGPTGLILNDPIERQSKSEKNDVDEPSKTLPMRYETTPALDQEIKSWEATFSNEPEESRYGSALHELAIAQLDDKFWSAYISIFVSQIRLLREIKSRGELSLSDAQNFSDVVVKENSPLSHWTLDRYLVYLISNELLYRLGSSLRMTPAGNDFLLFMHRKNLTDNRAY